MSVYNLFIFMCCVSSTVGLTGGRLRRMRRSACEFGTYQHEGKTCCLCPTGYQVTNDCTDKNATKCERCGDEAYMDHPNNDHQCQRCKRCDSNANMDIEDRCSPYSNTVCKCKENHYCDKGDLCKACYPCDTCEKHGVNHSCTETTNTVCKNAQQEPNEPVHPQPLNIGTIVAVLVTLIFLAGVGLAVFWLWRKGKLCFKDGQREVTDPKERLPLKDLNLNPHLSDIADVLGWKTMKSVARRSGMSKTEIEVHELNHSHDVKERTFALLEAWFQSQGLHGAYPTLIQTLDRMKEKRKADDIQEIVEKEAQP